VDGFGLLSVCIAIEGPHDLGPSTDRSCEGEGTPTACCQRAIDAAASAKLRITSDDVSIYRIDTTPEKTKKRSFVHERGDVREPRAPRTHKLGTRLPGEDVQLPTELDVLCFERAAALFEVLHELGFAGAELALLGEEAGGWDGGVGFAASGWHLEVSGVLSWVGGS
jgi:hypothetical protein